MNLSVSENIIMFVNKLSEATSHVIISTEDDRIHRGWPLFTEFVDIPWGTGVYFTKSNCWGLKG